MSPHCEPRQRHTLLVLLVSMAIVIEWPDQAVDVGPTEGSILEMIASDPWHPTTPGRVHALLSDRAWKLCGEAIDPELSTRAFFERLDAIGFLSIIEWVPEPGVEPRSYRRRRDFEASRQTPE